MVSSFLFPFQRGGGGLGSCTYRRKYPGSLTRQNQTRAVRTIFISDSDARRLVCVLDGEKQSQAERILSLVTERDCKHIAGVLQGQELIIDQGLRCYSQDMVSFGVHCTREWIHYLVFWRGEERRGENCSVHAPCKIWGRSTGPTCIITHSGT